MSKETEEEIDKDPYLGSDLSDLFGELQGEMDYLRDLIYDLGRLIERILSKLGYTV